MNYIVKRISKQAALLVMAVSLSVSTAAPTDEAALPTIKSRLLIALKAYSMKTKQKAENFGHCFLGNNQYSREEIQMARAKVFVVFAMLGISGVGIRYYLKKSKESSADQDNQDSNSSNNNPGNSPAGDPNQEESNKVPNDEKRDNPNSSDQDSGEGTNKKKNSDTEVTSNATKKEEDNNPRGGNSEKEDKSKENTEQQGWLDWLSPFQRQD